MIMDDIIIHGATRKAHDEALENCLKRLEALNLKAKGDKCHFLQKEILFYGLIFSAEGTKPDPARIDNLVKTAPPKNASEVRSFLGMANTCQDYIPQYASISAPLRELTKKNTAFEWKHEHQKAFEQLKKKLTKSPVMSYFDTAKRSLVIVDASPQGISAILAQREHQSDLYKIISYASRATSPVERRYSQTDLEGLSLVWGIEHFRLFLLGSVFDVITDHQALEAIFNNPRSKPPARIERWMMRLQPYNFRVIYKKGSTNEADYMSRHPTSFTLQDTEEVKEAEAYVNYIVNHTVPKSMTVEQIQEATREDPTLQKVLECLKTGVWEDKDANLRPYKLCKDELSTNETRDIVLRGTRLVIPSKLQEHATQLGHVGHQGVEKTKSLLREKIWYPNMSKRVEEIIQRCIACQTVGQPNPPEPMGSVPTETKPWSSLAIDFDGPIPQSGQYLLVVTDIYSKFPEVEVVNSTESRAIIPKLDKIFATHGIPKTVKTDNGPPFNGQEFGKYMDTLGIEWKTSTPLWPRGNAYAESVMKPLGKLLKTAKVEGKNWRQELQRFLLLYRQTPHTTTKVAPCELLFNRRIKGLLPEMRRTEVVDRHEEAQKNIEKSKAEGKKYYDWKNKAKESGIKVGDTVICIQKKENKLTPRFNPELLTVVARKHSMVTAKGKDGETKTRNVSHLKKVEKKSNSEGKEKEREKGKKEIPVRRSGRMGRPVTRLGFQE